MPIVLTSVMTDQEVLRHVAEAYADPDNWKPYEKDYGSSCHVVERMPWGVRDQGDYARNALNLINSRNTERKTNANL